MCVQELFIDDVCLERDAFKPSAMPASAVQKMGFDPSARRKREFHKFIKTLPTPSLGRGLSSNDETIELDMEDDKAIK